MIVQCLYDDRKFDRTYHSSCQMGLMTLMTTARSIGMCDSDTKTFSFLDRERDHYDHVD